MFKQYLSMITGDGALTKLDVVDPIVEARRKALAKEFGFEVDSFDAALFVYVCNVLDESKMAPVETDRREMISNTAREIVKYFNNRHVLGKDTAELHAYASGGIDLDRWCDEKIAPSWEIMEKLSNDMKRVYHVWYENVLEA